MPFIPTANAAHLDMGYRDDLGRTWSNGFDFGKAAPWVLADLNGLVTAARDAWEELMISYFGSWTSLVKVSARALDSEVAPSVISDLATPIAGTRGGVSLPLHTCVVVTQRTPLGGRSYRGRIYHSGMAQADMFGQTQWEAGVAAAVGAAYGSFGAAIEEDTLSSQVVISKQNGGVTLAAGVKTSIVLHVGRIPIGTLRKRVAP